jgi:hypothetical protein
MARSPVVSIALASVVMFACAELTPSHDRTTRCGKGTFLEPATMECLPSLREQMDGSHVIVSSRERFAPTVALICTIIFVICIWFRDREYVLECEVDAPIDAVYGLLTNVDQIAEVHPQLRGISAVISQQYESNGAVIEWELETSAMWAPPWPLRFLKRLKTKEHVSTVATLTPGKHARIQNVGLKGYRGKIVPFYYLHYWDLVALGPKKTKILEYELLKGSAIKFLLGATEATIGAHKQIQTNLQQWAKDTWGDEPNSGPKDASPYNMRSP